MAVVIRMKRTGRRNRPSYRISVADSRMPRDGRTLETVGLYDPVSPNKDAQLSVNVERARDWITRGAVPSHTVRNMFRRAGVYDDGFAKPKPPVKRDKRKVDTKTSVAREARKKMMTERKLARANERKAAKAAAKKAAAAEGGSGDE